MNLVINSNQYTKDTDKQRDDYKKRVKEGIEITKKEEEKYNNEFKNKKYYDTNPIK